MTIVMYGSPRGMKAVRATAEGVGSIIRAGFPVAGDRTDVDGQGMPSAQAPLGLRPKTDQGPQGQEPVEDFMEEVVAEHRQPSEPDGSPVGLSEPTTENMGSALARRSESFEAAYAAN